MKSEYFGLPADVLIGVPSVRLLGNTMTEVVNHKGLKVCTDSLICVGTKIGDLSIEGLGLCIKEISCEGMRIEGTIKRIFYCR